MLYIQSEQLTLKFNQEDSWNTRGIIYLESIESHKFIESEITGDLCVVVKKVILVME